MKLKAHYKKFKTILSESKDILLMVSVSAGILFGAYMWWINHAHQAELQQIQNENEIIQRQANNFVAMALSETFISKLDSIIERKVSKQLDTLTKYQEIGFNQAADFYMLQSLRTDTIITEQTFQNKQDIKLQLEISKIKRQLAVIGGDTDYLRQSAYTDSLQNELDRLKSQQEAFRILQNMREYHLDEIQQIKKKYAPEYPTTIKRNSRKGLNMKTKVRPFQPPL